MLTGGKEYVKFDLNSSLNGAIRCEWEINIIADAKSISLLGEPQFSISKDSEYKSEFRILGENLNNTLLFLKNPPSWLSLVRETEHKFYLSGTPREIGTYTVNILVINTLTRIDYYRTRSIFRSMYNQRLFLIQTLRI